MFIHIIFYLIPIFGNRIVPCILLSNNCMGEASLFLLVTSRQHTQLTFKCCLKNSDLVELLGKYSNWKPQTFPQIVQLTNATEVQIHYSDKGTDKLLSLKTNVFLLWYNRKITWTMAKSKSYSPWEKTIYILNRLYCPKQPKPEISSMPRKTQI